MTVMRSASSKLSSDCQGIAVQAVGILRGLDCLVEQAFRIPFCQLEPPLKELGNALSLGGGDGVIHPGRFNQQCGDRQGVIGRVRRRRCVGALFKELNQSIEHDFFRLRLVR